MLLQRWDREVNAACAMFITLKCATQILKRVDILEHFVADVDLSKSGLSSPVLDRCYGFVDQCAWA